MKQKNMIENHNNLFLIVLLIVKIFLIRQISSAYYYPEWIQQKKWTITSAQSFYIDIHTNDYYIIIKKNQNFLFYDINTYNLLNTFNCSNCFILDYDIIDDTNLYILTNTSIQVYDIKVINGNKTNQFNISYTYSQIYLTQKQIILYFVDLNYIHLIHKRSRNNFTIQQEFNIIYNTKNIYRIKVCQKDPNSYYLAIWFSDYNLFLYYCIVGATCQNLISQQTGSNRYQINQIDFRSDCIYFIHYYNGYVPRIIYTNYNSLKILNNQINLNNPKQVFF